MSVSWVKLSLGVVGQIMPQVQVARRVLSCCIAPIRRNYPRQSRRRSIGKPVLDEIILLDSERAVRYTGSALHRFETTAVNGVEMVVHIKRWLVVLLIYLFILLLHLFEFDGGFEEGSIRLSSTFSHSVRVNL